jgi:hypothetical protein
MGFTIETYQLLGLPPLPNIYVSIQGSYSVKKNRPVKGYYQIFCTAYFSASKNDPVITEKDMLFQIPSLPSPAVLYLIIYDYIKGQLSEGLPKVDPYYATEQQVLVFQDD